MADTIKVIQGDSLKLKFSVEQGAELVEKMFFSCSKLKIVQELTKVEENNETYWLLNLSPNQTKTCECCFANYDITVQLYDGQIQTVVYNEGFNICKKENSCYGN